MELRNNIGLRKQSWWNIGLRNNTGLKEHIAGARHMGLRNNIALREHRAEGTWG